VRNRVGLGGILMLRTEEVIDFLHGIEGIERYFDKGGVPVMHGSIP
jgi:hypothetical protein